eukprot:COSAG01_NODE_2211_length_8159_cov_5.379032_3_plen_77_part_00
MMIEHYPTDAADTNGWRLVAAIVTEERSGARWSMTGGDSTLRRASPRCTMGASRVMGDADHPVALQAGLEEAEKYK